MAFALAFSAFAAAQPKVFEDRARIDHTVHDFGRVSQSDGPLSCEFILSNVGGEPLTILAVVSSCGCTGVEWTRETLQPGADGSIRATYSNDEGPYPFDKILTVYLTDVKKPVILHLRGEVTNKKSRK